MRANTIVMQKEEAGFSGIEQAFRHFNETSARLEAKYHQLLAESDRLREELRRKDAEIKQAERLATLGKTAAAIAHEVRNPLAAITLFVSLLKQDMADRPPSLELLTQVEQSVKNIDNVVSNILQFAKEQKPAFAPINLHALIQEQIALLKPAMQGAIDVELALAANPFVYGDEFGLRRLLYNLFLNSVQAMRSGGRLTVGTSDADGSVVICVKDSGPGINAEILDSLFEPFVTTKKEGTGLGLAVVMRVVKQHGGEVTAANNGGAQFNVCLPRCQPRSPLGAAPVQRADEERSGQLSMNDQLRRV